MRYGVQQTHDGVDTSNTSEYTVGLQVQPPPCMIRRKPAVFRTSPSPPTVSAVAIRLGTALLTTSSKPAKFPFPFPSLPPAVKCQVSSVKNVSFPPPSEYPLAHQSPISFISSISSISPLSQDTLRLITQLRTTFFVICDPAHTNPVAPPRAPLYHYLRYLPCSLLATLLPGSKPFTSILTALRKIQPTQSCPPLPDVVSCETSR